jgi:hypothetical protein
MGGMAMITRLSRIVFPLFLFVIMTVSYAWGESGDVAIVYSNNINGQVYPAG